MRGQGKGARERRKGSGIVGEKGKMNECGQRKGRIIREEGKVNGCGRVWVGVRDIAILVLKK